VGLERRGYSSERRATIAKAFRTLFRKGLDLDKARRALEHEYSGNDDVRLIVEFVAASSRGLLRTARSS